MQDPLAVSYKGQEGSGLAQVLPKSSFDVSDASKEMFEKTFAFELKKQQENKAKAAKLLDDLQIKMKDMQAKKKLEVLQKKRNFETKYKDVLAKYDAMNSPIPDKIVLELEQDKADLQSTIDTASQDYKDYGDFVSKVGMTKDVDPEATFANLQKAWNENNELDRSKLSFVFTEDPLGFIQKQVITPLKEQTGQTVSVSDVNGGIIETKVKQPLKSKQEILDDGREKLKTNPYLYNKYGTSIEGLNAWDNLVLSSIPKEITRDYQRNPQTQDNSFQIFGGGIKARRVPTRSGDPVYTIQTYNQKSVKQKKALVNASILTDEQGNKYGPSTDQVEFIPTSQVTVPYYNGKDIKSIPLTPADQQTYKAPGGVMYIYPGEPLPEFNNPGAYSDIIPNNEITLEDEILGVTPLGEGQYATVTAKTEDVGGVLKTNTDTKGRKILESTNQQKPTSGIKWK